MIIVNIIGGLGNQMFQYSYAKSLQSRGYDVKLDISLFKTYRLHGGYQLDKYRIDLDIANESEVQTFYNRNTFKKLISKMGFLKSKVLKEKTLLFNEKFQKPPDNMYIEGYFQCEEYFFNIRSLLKNNFLLKNNLSSYTKDIKSKILNCDNSVSLHIRRGDYITNKKANEVHGTCDLDYYIKAMEYLENNIQNIKYFIFSDDIDWVKVNLKVNNATYLDSKEERIPHEDIYLMSLCNHNIIANSSFSWWGAWLNENYKKIVIAPKRWFNDEKLNNQAKDIVCYSWIRL